MDAPAPLPAPSPQRFLRLPDVEALVGWKRSQIYAEMAAGCFPRQIRLAPRSVAWSEAEIAKWQAARIAERDGKIVSYDTKNAALASAHDRSERR